MLKIKVLEGYYKGRNGELVEEGTFTNIAGAKIVGAKVDIGCAGYLILAKGMYQIK